MTAERLPMPDWTRAGETWRVEPEHHMQVIPDGFVCGHHPGHGKDYCERPAVAGIVRRDELTFVLCAKHLREARVWIEDGRVVSWALRP